jgi:hypothetical protein
MTEKRVRDIIADANDFADEVGPIRQAVYDEGIKSFLASVNDGGIHMTVLTDRVVFCLKGNEERVHCEYYVDEALAMLDGMREYILNSAEDWYSPDDMPDKRTTFKGDED